MAKDDAAIGEEERTLLRDRCAGCWPSNGRSKARSSGRTIPLP